MQRLAKHVMKVHLNALQAEDTVEGELGLTTLKKFIAYARSWAQNNHEKFCYSTQHWYYLQEVWSEAVGGGGR